ncbi:MAG: glycosyltransferase family 4 protein [Terracidiphilus sp.]|jgi:glycosyltransferase involved in cell wall biosynthesis
MAAPNTFPGLTPNALMPRGARLPVFGTDSAFSMKRTSRRSNPTRIAVIGNHLPRQCGIATFTTDLCNAIAIEYKTSELSVVAVNDPLSPYAYPPRVRFEITEGDISSYRAAASYLNSKDIDLVCLQHEYGIYGGKAGSHVLELLRHLRMPVVTTLHTVLREPDADQRNVLQEIAARSERLVVMSEHSSRFLQDIFGVSEDKIDLIPHGIPDLPLTTPKVARVATTTKRKTVLLTFGLLSPNKGFENVIHALPSILSRHSDVVYIIAGATHPHVRLIEGDQYRFQLQALAKKLGVEENVIFYNRFVSPQEMASLVTSADIYITPYRYEAQAVSGTLAFALGAGKAIISTPYWYATELLANERGALVPFEDSSAIADATIGLLDDDRAREAMSKRAYLYARRMVWNRVAQSYMRTFVSARVNCVQPDRLGLSAQAVESINTSRLASA